ncbi:hypothetical protein OSB04_007196 [Centaurea solstitialis]|uniref:HAT C-terminal dimerisation domain-containing protein n=1 Tax=Centaurea solstitialis TaxID=347529 RepID=A0AA38TX89_9ASTR|nr:hypothetical protein OSB04_007196 [Centaurea solstitialis]
MASNEPSIDVDENKDEHEEPIEPTNETAEEEKTSRRSEVWDHFKYDPDNPKDNKPFSVVDDKGLREFAWELNPLFKFPSRWTVARDCLSIYKKEAKRLKDLLKGQTVSLTTDTWSSVQNFNYMCLTAHWVDDDWILRKKILNFCPIANHRGDTIGKLVYSCIQKWGIEKVFIVTVDNASSNDGAIRYLKTMLRGPNDVLDCKYLHLRCCAHIINLVVRDGLEEQCGSISRIRNAVRYVRSSLARYSSFKKCVDNLQIKCNRKPCLDVKTRWNSTFFMLETSVKYEDAFDRLFDIDSNYISYFQDEAEDDSGRSTRKRKRSGATNGAPTSQDWEKARHRENKTDFRQSEENFGGFVRALPKESVNLEHYQKRSGGSTSSNGMPSALGDTRIDLEREFDIYDDEEEDCKSELEVYLADGKEKRDERFDILGWWKANSTKFPILSQLARHVLAMPISTVASESAFSTGGRVIDKYRSSLNPKTAEALICTQDWIRSSPVDLSLFDMSIASIEELNEKLENIELGNVLFHFL